MKTIAILGCGARGTVYAQELKKHPAGFAFTALCDNNPLQLKRIQQLLGTFDIPTFSDADEFLSEKRADALIIATPDREHVSQAVRALYLGYDVLLEKPVSDSREEIDALLRAQKETGKQVIVCHVLRYAPGFRKCAEILQSGELGELYAIDASERVVFWHWAQAYVRGIGGVLKGSHPAILAKCSHDLDLVQSYAGSECDTVTSVGDRRFFVPENAPEGATERCLDCPHRDTCIYSAKRIYIDRWHHAGEPAYAGPYCRVDLSYPTTEEGLTRALREGRYGICAFRGPLDQPDHQMVQMTFKNGVKASLKMVYAANAGRRLTFYCTEGELIFDEREQKIEVMPFFKAKRVVDAKMILEHGAAHGGGDAVLSKEFGDLVAGIADCPTTLRESLECHLMGIAAEESRHQGGALINVHQ